MNTIQKTLWVILITAFIYQSNVTTFRLAYRDGLSEGSKSSVVSSPCKTESQSAKIVNPSTDLLSGVQTNVQWLRDQGMIGNYAYGYLLRMVNDYQTKVKELSVTP